MAIASTGQNPELIIDISYNSGRAVSEFNRITSRVESLAQAHQQKLAAIMNRGTTGGTSYYSRIENQAGQHLARLENLYQRRYSNIGNIQTSFYNKSASLNRNLSSVATESINSITASFKGQIPAISQLTTLNNNYAASFSNLSQAASTEAVQGLLAGGLLTGALSRGGTQKELINIPMRPIDTNSLEEAKNHLNSIEQHMYGIRDGLFRDKEGFENMAHAGELTAGHITDIEDKLATTQTILSANKQAQSNITQQQILQTQATEQYNKKLKETEEQLDKNNQALSVGNSLAGAMKGAMMAAGIIYAVNKAKDFVVELGRAGAQLEIIQKAFYDIGGTVDDINNLRLATFNAVPDQKLLATANYGNMMGVDLKVLPDLLKFATIRAQQTGEAVDYLTWSIVAGLGRRSPKILDNLGLRMEDLRIEIRKIFIDAGKKPPKEIGDMELQYFLVQGAVNLARKEIKKYGVDIDNLALKLQQSEARLENAKQKLGQSAPVKVLTEAWVSFVEGVAETMDNPLVAFDPFLTKAAVLEKQLEQFTKSQVKAWTWSTTAVINYYDTIEKREKQLKNRKFWNPIPWAAADLTPEQKQIKEYEDFMAKLESQNKSGAEDPIAKLRREIEERAKLKSITEQQIKVLEELAGKYKDNEFVMKLINQRLRESRSLIAEINGESADTTARGFDLTGVADTIKKNIAKQTKEFAKQMKMVNNTSYQADFRAEVKHINDLENKLKVFDDLYEKLDKNSKEAKILANMIEQIKDELKDVQPSSLDSVLTDYAKFYQDTLAPLLGETFNFANSLIDAQAVSLNNQLDVMERRIDLEQEYWDTVLGNLEEVGAKDTAYYIKQERLKQQAMEKLQAEELDLKSKAWEAEKEARIAGVIMTAAQAALAAWTFVPPQPWLSATMTGLIASSLAVQLSAIGSQTNPYSVKKNLGGWIGGTGYTDSVPALLTPGEFVVNRRAAQENADILANLNSGKKIPTGNSVVVNLKIDGNVISDDSWIEDKLIPGINRAISNGYNINLN